MTDEDHIWSTIRGIFESFSQRDEGGLESSLDDNCTVWDVFEPDLIIGAAQREAFHRRDKQQSEARGRLTWQLEPLKLDVRDDTAVARYYLHFEYQPPHAAAGRVRITDVLARHGDHWKVIHHHEGITPTGPPGFND